MKPYLKPCPFCGGEAKIAYDSTSNIVFGEESYLYAYCTSCGIRTPHLYYCPEQNQQNATEYMAIEMWNRRANNE